MKRRSIAMLVVAITVVLASCVSLGPTFMKEPSIPEGKALVYIYRPSSIVGSAVSYLVHADEMPVVTLYNGGYYPYFADPQTIQFWAKTESKSVVIVEAVTGQRYYVKGTVGMGLLVGRPVLTLVPPEIGGVEIIKCKRIQ